MSNTEAVVAILVVAMTVGIPLAGLTLRFSLKPLVEAWVRVREAYHGSYAGSHTAELEALRQRVAVLESRLGEWPGRSGFELPADLTESLRRKA